MASVQRAKRQQTATSGLFGCADSTGGEEILQQGHGFVGADTFGDVNTMIGAVVAEDFEAGMDRAALGLVRSINQAGDAGLQHCAGAHGAGFDGDVKSSAEQAVIAEAEGGVTEGENFGMRGGIAVSDGPISGARDDFFVEDQDCADRNFAAPGGFAGFEKRFGHEGEIGV